MFALDNIKRFLRLVSTSSIDSDQQYRRLKLMERDIGVPVKIAVLCLMAYFLFFSEVFPFAFFSHPHCERAPPQREKEERV